MITTDRLIVRKLNKEDFRDLYDYLSLESIYKYEPGEPVDLETAKKMAEKRSKTDSFYAVELKTSKKVIGHIYFQKINPEELMTWEIGYIFNPKYHKNGFATESIKAIIEFAFNNWNIHKVIAHCNPDNIASWKLLEKIGLKREGRLRKNIFFRKDEEGYPIWCDTYEYGFLREDLIH